MCRLAYHGERVTGSRVSGLSVDVVIVGGGQAGLGAAFHLAHSGIELVVLERGRLGETWRSQRWDSFALNTPNWMNGLPGAEYDGSEPFGFMTHHELVASFEEYAERFGLNVRTGIAVTRAGRSEGDRAFLVVGEDADGEHVQYESDALVVASGILQSPRIPALSALIPTTIDQLHTATYRSAAELPDGAVVVVGGGQSGAQVVEDLLSAGREVYYSISKTARFPRRYRGRDFMDWFVDMGVWDMRTEDVDDPAVLAATNPLVSGVGPLGHSVSFQQLARDGAVLMGRLDDVVDGRLITDDRVVEYVRFADSKSEEIRGQIDAFIAESGVESIAPEHDRADVPLLVDAEVPFLTELDLEGAGVGTVIWCTGFTADFSWIDLPVTDHEGMPVHDNGVAPVPGVYFIGFPWLSKRKSGVVFGIDDDARHITDTIIRRRALV